LSGDHGVSSGDPADIGRAGEEAATRVSCPLVAHLIEEQPLILGSGSPRRRRILDGLGLDFVVDVPGVPEELLPGEGPEEHVLRLAGGKARDVASRHERGTIIAADTIVLIDGRVLGKPSGPEQAVEMLKTIRGRWHEVFTGVAASRASDGAVSTGHERTRVLVRDLSDREVDEYVAGGEPLDKAGSYGIQDCGAAVVERVEGCFYNVVGLPVVRMCSVLEKLSSER
jgi:septum formation protein